MRPRRRAWRVAVALVLVLPAIALAARRQVQPSPAPNWLTSSWSTFGHSPNHDGQSAYSAQPLNRIVWKTSVDLAPQYSGGVLYVHYGSPLVSRANNVVVTTKIHPYSDFVVQGRRGSDGLLLWAMPTDWTPPSAGWFPPCGPTLTPDDRVVVPAIGGTVLRRESANQVPSHVDRLAFYGLANFESARAVYSANVQIDTPIACDDFGNLYFGFVVLGATPLSLQSGVARIGADGSGTWIAASSAANDASIQQVVTNCTPALTRDGAELYVAVRDGGGAGYLVGLDARTLAPLHRVRCVDPMSGLDAALWDLGTASPTVGPDGDVYYGVLENPFGSNHVRGWLLHYDGTLATTKTPGDFGWDDTASLVPSQAVPSYTGASKYLLVTKYNNYAIGGGNGLNKVGVLDPNATQVDPQTGATVMQEVITMPGPTPDPANGPLAVKEWCIDDIAVDAKGKCALVNSEDGLLYRWDFTTNTLSQRIVLTSGIGEAYTPTVIGVDGKVYAINNAILFAVGQ